MRYKNRWQPADSLSVSRITAIYKEVISILKDTLDVLWKISPIVLFPPGLFIWSYLKSLGWTSLFHESVVTGSGLVFLALAALLLAFGIAITFILPSFFLIGTTQIFDAKQKISQRTVAQYKWAALGWFLTAAGFMYVEKEFVWLLFLPPLILSTSRGLFSIYKSEQPEKILREVGKVMAIATLSTLAVSFQVVPISLCLDSFDQLSGATDLEAQMLFVAFILFSTLSIVPGFMYIHARTRHTDTVGTFKFPLLGSLFVAYLALIAAGYFTPVSALVLRAAGIYSDNPKTFQIFKPELAAALTTSGIQVRNDPTVSTTTAYVRFHFSGIRLLCKEKYEPMKGAFHQDQNAKKARFAGKHCVPAKSDELREFTP